MTPKIIIGANHTDVRGTLFFNNDFDATGIKRLYIIENEDNNILRAWQGHRIEKRWFSAMKGSFEIQLIAVTDWDNPSKESEKLQFVLHSEAFHILHIPAGYVCSIQSLEEGSKLLVMANYQLGELKDDYRYPVDYFN